jgi:hypothetical protein
LIRRHGFGKVDAMPACGHQALLVVTQNVEGTTTSVARKRVELRCSLPNKHDGPHHDESHGERWEGKRDQKQTILRHEDEEP